MKKNTIINREVATKQHADFVKLLREYTSVHIVPVNGLDPDGNLPDIIYCAEAALFLPGLPQATAILTKMSRAHRQPEEVAWSSYMKTLPIKTIKLPSKSGLFFEGSGEAIYTPDLSKLFCGYGIRNTLRGVNAVAKTIEDIYRSTHSIDKKPEFYPIKLINPKYFHLDLAFRPLNNNIALIHRDAIAPKSIELIESIYGKDNLIDVNDSEPFACNGVVLDNTYICSTSISAKTIREIERRSKMNVRTTPMTEFQKGGGSVKCMVLPIL